jgi:hypothetical protein
MVQPQQLHDQSTPLFHPNLCPNKQGMRINPKRRLNLPHVPLVPFLRKEHQDQQ